MKIPPLDLTQEYREIKREITPRLARVLKSGHFVLGKEAKTFEAHFARFIGTKHCIAVASGTDALLLSLMALGIGPCDEVVTSAFTFIATATGIARVGAKPVFVDIDPNTFNLDPELLEQKITSRTKAIIPVHLYGAPCDMVLIRKIAQQHNLSVIEDCAQAAGARWKGKGVGSFGDLGAFSFYPTKTLGAYGDGGAITTNDSKLAALLRSLRDHGAGSEKYHHERIGINSRLDELQAAVLNVKLKHLAGWNKKRKKVARIYDKLFSKARLPQVQIPKRSSDSDSVFHQYGILTERRDELLEFLRKKKIAANVYYPLPLHLQTCFRELGYQPGDLPETERASTKVLNLPIYPQLRVSAQKFIVSKIKKFLS